MNGEERFSMLEVEVPEHLDGQRFDLALVALFPDYSRARIQRWIRSGDATLDGERVSPKHRVSARGSVALRPVSAPETPWRAQPIALEVLYEDGDLMVIDKPAGLVVHPGAGVRDGTLANALIDYSPRQAELPRAGIVHRLDQDTTGVLAIARSLRAHGHLVRLLKERRIHREYQAIVTGTLTGGGRVDAPIGRHRTQRTKMAVRGDGKPAVTHYRIAERFPTHTHVRLALESGRTHQIRVHMAHIGHAIVGDAAYGGRARIPAGCDAALARLIQGFPRQALHAARLEFPHPVSGVDLDISVPLPEDMRELLAALRAAL